MAYFASLAKFKHRLFESEVFMIDGEEAAYGKIT